MADCGQRALPAWLDQLIEQLQSALVSQKARPAEHTLLLVPPLTLPHSIRTGSDWLQGYPGRCRPRRSPGSRYLLGLVVPEPIESLPRLPQLWERFVSGARAGPSNQPATWYGGFRTPGRLHIPCSLCQLTTPLNLELPGPGRLLGSSSHLVHQIW